MQILVHRKFASIKLSEHGFFSWMHNHLFRISIHSFFLSLRSAYAEYFLCCASKRSI